MQLICTNCGKSYNTSAAGLKNSKRLLCRSCRIIHNRWENLCNKAHKSGRKPTFATFEEYCRQAKPVPKEKQHGDSKWTPPTAERELTKTEIREMRSFGQRKSPCLNCENLMCDKNTAPCVTCPQIPM